MTFDCGGPPNSDPTEPFYLIVTDHGLGVFAVEGRMTDDGSGKTRHAEPATISVGQPAAPLGLIATPWRPSIAA